MIEQDGKVAIAYYQTIPHFLEIHGKTYQFTVRANICMIWADVEDVPAIMAMTKVCCGGKKTHPHRYANENDVRRWTNGGGR